MLLYTYENEAKLLVFTRNLADRLAADPAAFGTDAPAVAALAEARRRFADARDVATAEPTRTASAIARKESARKFLIALTRQTVRQLQAWGGMDDPKRRALGIPVPRRARVDIPPPAEAPRVDILLAVRHAVRLRLRGPGGERRRPAGTAGAAVLYALGPTPPADPRRWVWLGQWTSGTFDLDCPPEAPPGTTVWVTACYLDRRGRRGPLADAATTNLPGGQASRLAA